MTQHEKLSEAQMAHIRSLIQPAPPSDLERSIAEANRLDRRAEYVARLGVFLAALAGLAVIGAAVWGGDAMSAEVFGCDYVAGCSEIASFEATPVSKTHDCPVKHSCVRHLGKVINYNDDSMVDYWTVERLWDDL